MGRELFVMESGKLGITVTQFFSTNIKIDEEITGYLILDPNVDGSYCWDTPEHRNFFLNILP